MLRSVLLLCLVVCAMGARVTGIREIPKHRDDGGALAPSSPSPRQNSTARNASGAGAPSGGSSRESGTARNVTGARGQNRTAKLPGGVAPESTPRQSSPGGFIEENCDAPSVGTLEEASLEGAMLHRRDRESSVGARAAADSSFFFKKGGEEPSKSHGGDKGENKKSKVDGLCHCMNKKDFKAVDWDDFDKFDEEKDCFKKCPKICVDKDKDIFNDYAFYRCPRKGMWGFREYECECIDFKDTQKRMQLEEPGDVYAKVFMRWNFHDNDRGDTEYYERKDDIKDCMEDCDEECHKAPKAIDENDKLVPGEELKGVCTASKFDWED